MPTKLKLEKIFNKKIFFWIVKINTAVASTGIREKKPGNVEFLLKIKNEIKINTIEKRGTSLKNKVNFS